MRAAAACLLAVALGASAASAASPISERNSWKSTSAVSVVQSAYAVQVPGSFTVSLPRYPTPGNTLLILLSYSSYANEAFTCPSGSALIKDARGANQYSSAVAYNLRVIGGNTNKTITCTSNGSSGNGGGMMVVELKNAARYEGFSGALPNGVTTLSVPLSATQTPGYRSIVLSGNGGGTAGNNAVTGVVSPLVLAGAINPARGYVPGAFITVPGSYGPSGTVLTPSGASQPAYLLVNAYSR